MVVPKLQTGLWRGEFPFARVGEGIRELVIFPGIHDALEDAVIGAKFWAWFGRDLADDRVVWVISRKRHLPARCGIEDMAGEYARLFREVIGKADVLGVSMGSAIAQQFAAQYPDHVDRLILGMAGPRLDPETRPTCYRWMGLARMGDWRELYLDMIGHTYGASRRALFEAMSTAPDTAFGQRASTASDFIISMEACLRYDSTDCLGAIQARTLVLGGTEDRLMPADGLRELAARIPGATLRLFEGAGHGLFEERKIEFDAAIVNFLADR